MFGVLVVDGHILAVHTLPLVCVYVCSGGGGWAHISCALWIPEVRFGVPERMKNIIINQVPARRWSLLCSLCRKKEGACIQCYCASCTVAYHVTCGFNHGLEMKTSPDGTKVIHEVMFISVLVSLTYRMQLCTYVCM